MTTSEDYKVYTGKTVAEAEAIRESDPTARIKLAVRDRVSLTAMYGLDRDGRAVIAADADHTAEEFVAILRRRIARKHELIAGARLSAEECHAAARAAGDDSPWPAEVHPLLRRQIADAEEWIAAYESGGAVPCVMNGHWWLPLGLAA